MDNHLFLMACQVLLNIRMNIDQLLEQGNQHRANHQPELALKCYAAILGEDFNHGAAFNNYGNVLREMGYPARAIPFLHAAHDIDPSNVTTEFNLAVAYLINGDYEKGWRYYEARWRYEHMSGVKPKLPKPEWTGQDLKDKTILLVGEQGLGDQIQFLRFSANLLSAGAKIKLVLSPSVKTLFPSPAGHIIGVYAPGEDLGEYDYWISMMSIPRVIGLRLETITHQLQYIAATPEKVKEWTSRLGVKKRMRIGVCWRGREDSWIHNHKAIPIEKITDLIRRNPEHQWINLTVDSTEEESAAITAAGGECYPGTIKDFSDTAGLMHHLDLVISVDTANAHLAGAMGRPVWIPLNAYGNCWRWLLKREDSPWYPSARLYRQPVIGDWDSVINRMHKFLGFFKI
jgi:tetratricopeptide (TPR) repeat protein